jgi:hypothetical protein
VWIDHIKYVNIEIYKAINLPAFFFIYLNKLPTGFGEHLPSVFQNIIIIIIIIYFILFYI